jgi:putative YhdH/YhfP family quinone oxidoreductase
MALGTAGFTAGMAIAEIANEIKPENGPILVTGATGGVGSLAVNILAKLGYAVTVVTGKESAHEFLKNLGATAILSREQALEKKERPVLKPQWAGVVDTVGGEYLANAIKSTNLNGIVTACGNVASPDLPINVFPFILRGVKLIGIDSQNCEMAHREEIWKKLACDWKPENLLDFTREIFLSELPHEIDQILKGKMQGRVFVKL